MTTPARSVSLWLTLAIVVAHVVAVLSGQHQAWLLGGGFIPVRFFDGVGNGLPGFVPGWLTPLSATFLHAGIMHLGFNALMMAFVGRQLELPLGAGPMILLFVVGAYAAALVEAMVSAPSQVMIGASGALSAWIGAYALIFNGQNVRPIGPIPAVAVRALWLAIAWIGVQALMGYAAGGTGVGLAIGAHIGGFLAGLVMVRPLLRWRFRAR